MTNNTTPDDIAPEQRESLNRGLQQSKDGETVDLGDFSQYLVPDEDETVDTEALRALAGELYGDWTDWDLWEAHAHRRNVAAAADELDRLRAVIADAPHMPHCQMSYLSTYPDARCSCWKAEAEETR